MKPNLVHRKCQRSSEKMKQLSKSQALKPRPTQDNIGLKHCIPIDYVLLTGMKFHLQGRLIDIAHSGMPGTSK
jgi:hypothetical protein